MRRLLGGPAAGEEERGRGEFEIQGGGVLFRVFGRLFRLVDRCVFLSVHSPPPVPLAPSAPGYTNAKRSPWKMYPLGVLFGLGFDTSSEIALLGIASIQAAHGTSIWLILLFPVLFAAGMCLLDTIDGALMMALYTSASLARDAVAVLYYNIILSALTVAIAVTIGALQALGLVLSVAPELVEGGGGFWGGVQAAQEHYDVIGGAICGAFVVGGGVSVLVYGPWRRWVDEGRGEEVVLRGEVLMEGDGVETDGGDVEQVSCREKEAESSVVQIKVETPGETPGNVERVAVGKR